MTLNVEVNDLHVHYGETRALEDVSFTLAGGTIVGLLGRNGAGKSTLLATLAAFRRPTRGAVRVDGEDPWEHHRLMSEICLIREDGDVDGSVKVRDTLRIAGCLRPRWDQDDAERLLDAFELSPKKRVSSLSRGQRSALAVTIGLATQAPLTMFDEPHLGMDAPSRYRFYDELLADYLATGRTFIISTHLIDEVAALLEDVVILDHGRVLTHQSATELQSRGVEITGPADRVDELTRNMSVLSSRSLGPTKSVVVFGQFNGHLREHATAEGIELGPIPLQDLFVSLTSKEHVMMTTVRAPAETSGKPAISQASFIVTFGTLLWLGWTWLVAAVVYGIVLTAVVIWGEVDVSLFQSVFAGWQRWLVFAAGVTMTTTFLRMLVRNGSTRALVSSASTVAMAVIASIGTTIIAAGWVIEKFVYDRQGWPQRLDSGNEVFEWSDLWRVAIESPIVLAVFFVSGWLVGVGFYRFGVVGGLLLLLPSLIPAALIEVITTRDFGGLDLDVIPEIGAPGLLLTLIGGVALVAASVAVARRVTIGTPLR